MGVYASVFHKSSGQVLIDSTDPSQANWITAHSDACKMPVPEVQRCWGRFLLLQPDKNGNVHRHRFIKDDIFNRQLVQQIPVTEDGLVTFQTYCSAVYWLSNSSIETKLGGLYQTLACSSLNKDSLERLLQALYPKESQGGVNQLSSLLMWEMDTKNQGFIDEDQFIAWMKKLPQETLTALLHFSVIPHKLTAASAPQIPQRDLTTAQDSRKVTDNQLLKIAVEMSRQRRDWKLLANSLGFLETDSQTFERKHLEVQNQIVEMLQVWRSAAGQQDPVHVLQTALRDSGNTDINNEVFHLSF